MNLAGDLDDDVAAFAFGIDVTVGFRDIFQGIAAVDDGFDSARFVQLGQAF